MPENIAVVETCCTQEILPHMNAIANACEALGYRVIRWERTKPLPRCTVVFWWEDNVSSSTRKRAARYRARIFHLSVGWTIDRYAFLQVDPQGCYGMASWAKDPLEFESSGPPELNENGDLLVCLQFEGAVVRTSSQCNPYFASNLDWVEMLVGADGGNHPTRMRLRPHPRTPDRYLEPLSKFVLSHAPLLAWDERIPFEESVKRAKAVAIISGSCGVQALQFRRPVLCYGVDVVRHEKAAYCLDADLAKTRDVLISLQEGRCDLDLGAMEAVLRRVQAHQWPLAKSRTFARRLKKEFGL